MSRPDDNTAKTGGGALTPEDAVALDRAIASQPDPLPRGKVVRGEEVELEWEAGKGLKVVAYEAFKKGFGCELSFSNTGLEELGYSVWPLTPLAPAQERIRELEGEVLELEGRLERVRPVVRAALAKRDFKLTAAHQYHEFAALADLTPADRAWAEEP